MQQALQLQQILPLLKLNLPLMMQHPVQQQQTAPQLKLNLVRLQLIALQQKQNLVLMQPLRSNKI